MTKTDLKSYAQSQGINFEILVDGAWKACKDPIFRRVEPFATALVDSATTFNEATGNREPVGIQS